MATDPALAAGERFLAVVARQDFGALAGFLAPEVHFRFATPNTAKDLVGPAEVAKYLAKWFGPTAQERTMVASGVELAAPGRARVWYRLRVRPQPVTLAPGWHTIEQQVYLDAGAGPVGYVGLVCTGFQPDPSTTATPAAAPLVR
jgi:hypothetical protein